MQFGIFTVGDVTTDPTTGATPSEAERIRATVTIAKKAEEVELDVFATGEHHNPRFVPSSPTTLLGYSPHKPSGCCCRRRQPRAVPIGSLRPRTLDVWLWRPLLPRSSIGSTGNYGGAGPDPRAQTQTGRRGDLARHAGNPRATKRSNHFRVLTGASALDAFILDNRFTTERSSRSGVSSSRAAMRWLISP
jgi:hypothetical protein